MTDELDRDWRARLVAATRATSGLVPLFGGVLAELVSETIPRQRQDRIVAYLRLVQERLANLDEEVSKAAVTDPEKIDLIETGGYQSSTGDDS